VTNRDELVAPDSDELDAWFCEFQRLVDEAKVRFDAGDLMPALASLAAVRPVHRLLVDRCAGLLTDKTRTADDSHSTRVGLYL
jgi:hypothetical protein